MRAWMKRQAEKVMALRARGSVVGVGHNLERDAVGVATVFFVQVNNRQVGLGLNTVRRLVWKVKECNERRKARAEWMAKMPSPAEEMPF